MPRLKPPPSRSAAALAVRTEPVIHGEEPRFENVDEGAQDQGQDRRAGGLAVDPKDLSEDPTNALKAQIEALRKSEREAVERAETARREAEEAGRRASERDAEMAKLQEQTVSSQQEAIDAALVAAQAEADAATRDYEGAASLGDYKAMAEAQRKMARAENKVLNLEAGKDTLERQIKEAATLAETRKPGPKPLTQEDHIRALNLPQSAKDWLVKHPEYVFNSEQNAEIQYFHHKVLKEGHRAYSPDYFESIEKHLGLRQVDPILEDDDMEDEPVQRRPSVSAPPSREIPSSSGERNTGRVTLTARQKEAAKIAGVTEAEYAKQLINLNKAKAEGHYGGGQ